ncbi:MAG: murein biosynthesis integral membrane protein MurJ [Desulfomonilaceae bacterium]
MKINTSEKRSNLKPTTIKNQIASEKKLITKAAGIVGFWTSVSRISGFIRDMIIAIFLGAGTGADAFFVAFRIPNLLRRLFAEGALSAAFVPTFIDTMHRSGRDEGVRLARIAVTFAALVLLVVTFMGIVFTPQVVRVTAPGFFSDHEKFNLTVELTRIMFPYIFFISLVALVSGVLNSLGRFAAPAAAPILLNLSMIAGVLALTRWIDWTPYHSLAWAVTAAGVFQLCLQIPFLVSEGITLKPDFHFGYPPLKRMGRLFVPAAIGGAVYQINVLVGTVLASTLPSGSVSWLYYADRLVQLPLGVFAIALGSAALPSMSRLASTGDYKGLGESVSFSLRLIAFFTIPASVALIILRGPIIGVLFQHGRFTQLDTAETAYALLWYTAGLWAFSGLKVVTQAFFSLKDTKTPLWISLVAVIMNLAAGLILMNPMRHGGLALATTISAAFNFVLLFVILIKRIKWFEISEFLVSIGKISAASIVMGAFLVLIKDFGLWSHGLTGKNFLILSISILAGMAVFGVSAYLFRCEQIKSIRSVLKI